MSPLQKVTNYCKMKKSSAEFLRHFAPNLKAFYFWVVAFVGLLMIVFNGVTLGKTYLENEVFGIEYSYLDTWQCEKNYDAQGNPVEISDEDYEECMDDITERAKETFVTETKRSYASGLSGLFFGLLLWIPHFSWARRS